MSDYTPTAHHVRDGYLLHECGGPDHDGHHARLVAEFDRFLASVKAEAWDEAIRYCNFGLNDRVELMAGNPYRTKGTTDDS